MLLTCTRFCSAMVNTQVLMQGFSKCLHQQTCAHAMPHHTTPHTTPHHTTPHHTTPHHTTQTQKNIRAKVKEEKVLDEMSKKFCQPFLNCHTAPAGTYGRNSLSLLEVL